MATGNTIVTPDHIIDACAEGVISTVHNDAYGLPLPQYAEEPEYTNVRLYEATMRLYFDPTSTGEPPSPSTQHPQSSQEDLSMTDHEDIFTTTNSNVDLVGQEMCGGEVVPNDQHEPYASNPHPQSSDGNLSLTEDATDSRDDLVDPDGNKMYGGESVSGTDQHDLAPKFLNHSHSDSTSINAVLSSAGNHKLKQVQETTV